MTDSFTEVTTQSWGSRLKASLKGILIGLVLVAVSFPVLFKNEGRAVRRYRALNEGGRDVVSIDAGSVSPANEGALVHLSGPSATTETLRDADFGVAIQAIHLDRTVVMYQWREHSESRTEKKTGGSTETTTTYSYDKGWSEQLIDSRRFTKPAGHANPSTMPYRSGRLSAQKVILGAFRLGAGLIDRIQQATELPVRALDNLSPQLQSQARLAGDGIYVGPDPSAPRVGDLRVRFSYVAPQVVTVVARQTGTELGPYDTRSGGELELLRHGPATAEEIFTAAHQANQTLTWILRMLGFLTMAFGFRMLLAPFGVMADVFPLLGNLVSRGATFVAAVIALPLSLLTIGVAWLLYRPLLAIAIFLLAGIGLVLLLKLLRNARQRSRQAPPAPAEEPELPPLPASEG